MKKKIGEVNCFFFCYFLAPFEENVSCDFPVQSILKVAKCWKEFHDSMHHPHYRCLHPIHQAKFGTPLVSSIRSCFLRASNSLDPAEFLVSHYFDLSHCTLGHDRRRNCTRFLLDFLLIVLRALDRRRRQEVINSKN